MIFLGDSITDSDRLWDDDGRNLGHGYVRILADRFPEQKVINRGHNGFTAYQVERYLEDDCIKYLPDTVTLLVGINDVSARIDGAGGYDAAEYEDYLVRILHKCKENGATKLILMEPFLFAIPAIFKSWMGELALFQAASKRAAEMCDARFIPLADIFQQAMKEYPIHKLTVDGIHLTELGHQILAENWMKYSGNITSPCEK